MSTILAVTNGQVITEFDNFYDISWCSPKVLGCSLCVSAKVDGGKIVLTLQLNTPLGSWSKSISFSNNYCFTLQPLDRIKAEICITGYKIEPKEICFTLSASICIKVPVFGWKCAKLSHDFCVPVSVAETALDQLSDAEFAAVYALALQTEGSKGCNCH